MGGGDFKITTTTTGYLYITLLLLNTFLAATKKGTIKVPFLFIAF